MSKKQHEIGREPVPEISRLLALSFISGLAGALQAGSAAKLRCTLHRVMSRGTNTYLQQLCPYLPEAKFKESDAGRIFGVDEGIMGAAYQTRSIWRTKHHRSPEAFNKALLSAKKLSGEPEKLTGEQSWLAVPILGKSGDPVLVLFAESEDFNYFSNDAIVLGIVNACNGFVELLNILELSKSGIVRNYPLPKGTGVLYGQTAYVDIHENFDECQPPTSLTFDSFNFEG